MPMIGYPQGTMMLPNGSVMDREMAQEIRKDQAEATALARTQNALVACAQLRSAAQEFLRLPTVIDNMLGRGNSSMTVSSLNSIVNNLWQAEDENVDAQTNTMTLPPKADHSFVKTREMFEHCINVVNAFKPLIEGPIYTWNGWAQQARKIQTANTALAVIINNAKKDEKIADVVKDVECFHKAVAHIADSYEKRQDPDANTVAGIYTDAGLKDAADQIKGTKKLPMDFLTTIGSLLSYSIIPSIILAILAIAYHYYG